MSAFSKAASATIDSVAGVFGVVSADPAALKAGVVAGISQSLGQSFGNDVGLTRKFEM